ncbi:helix-turn-helix transcriptional regulator [Streptomyces sp. CB03234]|uniref:helix-turn-helix transcriptional regulator n=1 Tax=Streptomyces sp. (strain CB03234) TaxID=1703937 RepID=UPI001F521D58|nr:DNA-binding response regulator [Streptomyces sp. CB03234]
MGSHGTAEVGKARRTGADGGIADLEQTLLQAQALIESSVSLHRRHADVKPPVERMADDGLREAVERLTGGARHSVGVALTGPGGFADAVVDLLPAIPDRATVRVLCAVGPAMEPVIDRLGTDARERLQVRVSESELQETLVVDGVSALVRAPEAAGGQGAVVNDTAAVRALELLFAGTWSRGRRRDDTTGCGSRLRTELMRAILERLRAGDTDEIAARELNVSLRTYRRYVAKIMRELDASSRFQAGVRAVESGLLSE